MDWIGVWVGVDQFRTKVVDQIKRVFFHHMLGHHQKIYSLSASFYKEVMILRKLSISPGVRTNPIS